MANLTNINFMSSERYNALTETSRDELYATAPSDLPLDDCSNEIFTTAWLSKVCNPTTTTSISSGYVTTRPCFIRAVASGETTAYVDLNGVRVFGYSWSASRGSPDNIGYLVGKGVTITASNVSLYVLT